MKNVPLIKTIFVFLTNARTLAGDLNMNVLCTSIMLCRRRCAVNSFLCAECGVQCAVCCVLCEVCGLQCVVCGVQSVVCSVLCVHHTTSGTSSCGVKGVVCIEHFTLLGMHDTTPGVSIERCAFYMVGMHRTTL